MPLITCPDCAKQFSDAAAACPNCGRPNKAVAATAPATPAAPSKQNVGCLQAGCLAILVLGLVGMCIGNSTTPSNRASDPFATPAPAPVATEPQLELQSWNWHEEHGYAIVEGRVKNISTESLRNVQAVVTFSDKRGGHITSDDALIDYNPILPGQTSPFKVMATWNPAMNKASVDFKELMGGTIRWRDRPKKK